jgi:hypothetical protein
MSAFVFAFTLPRVATIPVSAAVLSRLPFRQALPVRRTIDSPRILVSRSPIDRLRKYRGEELFNQNNYLLKEGCDYLIDEKDPEAC